MLLHGYEIPSTTPGKYAAPDELWEYRRKNDLSQISRPVHSIGVGRFLDVCRDGVYSRDYSESRGPSHRCEDQYDRCFFLVEFRRVCPCSQDFLVNDSATTENR